MVLMWPHQEEVYMIHGFFGGKLLNWVLLKWVFQMGEFFAPQPAHRPTRKFANCGPFPRTRKNRQPWRDELGEFRKHNFSGWIGSHTYHPWDERCFFTYIYHLKSSKWRYMGYANISLHISWKSKPTLAQPTVGVHQRLDFNFRVLFIQNWELLYLNSLISWNVHYKNTFMSHKKGLRDYCLVGGFIFFIVIPIWGRFPIWLIFFRWVETTN